MEHIFSCLLWEISSIWFSETLSIWYMGCKWLPALICIWFVFPCIIKLSETQRSVPEASTSPSRTLLLFPRCSKLFCPCKLPSTFTSWTHSLTFRIVKSCFRIAVFHSAETGHIHSLSDLRKKKQLKGLWFFSAGAGRVCLCTDACNSRQPTCFLSWGCVWEQKVQTLQEMVQFGYCVSVFVCVCVCVED